MLRSTLVGLTIAASLAAQSPLTTLFGYNGASAVGGGIYFDLNVTHPAGITITGLDLNCNGTGSIEVYTLAGTRIGFQTNPAAWTLASSGAVVGAVPNAISPVAITSIPLAAGSYGVALKAVGVAHHYTNGNGFNQNYATAELALAAGEVSNVAFAAPLFTPRVVNCRIHYVSGTGTPATNTTLGVGCVSLALAGGTRPVTGTNWNLNVTNIPATGVIGVDIFGLADPGINDLFFLGMPGCPLRSTLDSLGPYVALAPTHSYSLAIPNNPALVNVHIFTTSAVFQVPPVNAFGAITSNGVDGKIGDL